MTNLISCDIMSIKKKKRIENRFRKGKDMTTINRFYYLDSERILSATLKSYKKNKIRKDDALTSLNPIP